MKYTNSHLIVLSSQKIPSTGSVLLSVGLAAGFWFVIFRAQLFNFWLAMPLAVIILCGLAFFAGTPGPTKNEVNRRNLLRGLISAGLLYAIFAAGNWLSQTWFAFAPSQISAIYNIRQEAPPYLIAVILLFITSPGEEFFWRGFLQSWAMKHFSPLAGWLIVALLYGAVHLVAGNIMLVLAALTAGLFWGWLYRLTGSLVVVSVSHAVWAAAIFVWFPLL